MAHISRKVQNLHINKKKDKEFINELGRGGGGKKAPLLGETSHLLEGDKLKCIDEKLAFMHYGA